MSCTFLLLRLVLGFPTWDWFRETLISLPRYHADSTGHPLPLALKGHLPVFTWKPGILVSLVGFPMMMLLAMATYVGTLRKIVERRLPLEMPRDRVYLLFLLYGLFNLKNVFDRSDPYHVVQGTHVLALVVLFDGMEYLRDASGRQLRRSWAHLPASHSAFSFGLASTTRAKLGFYCLRAPNALEKPSHRLAINIEHPTDVDSRQE